MTWKKVVNSDPGDVDHFGGDDGDKISDLFSGVDVDDVDINSDWKFRSGKLQLANPANTASFIIVTPAITTNKTLNIPFTTGTDTLATLGLSQTFTSLQTIKRNSAAILNIYRDNNAVGSGIGIQLEGNDSLGNETVYSVIRGEIDTNTDTLEDGHLEIEVKRAGTQTKVGEFRNDGDFQFGANMRALLSESGLSALRTFTFPNTTTELTGLAATQTNTAAKTFNDQTLKLRNPANTFSYTIVNGAITADRDATLPVLTANDTFTFNNTTATLQNKTIDVGGYANPTGNVVRGSAIQNPYLGQGTGATLRRTGLFPAVASNVGHGLWASSLTAIGTFTRVNDTTEGVTSQFATTAVANANAGLRQTVAFYRREWTSYMILRIKLSSTSDIRAFIGWSSDGAEIAGETTLDNFSGVGIGRRAADTNWFTYRNDGDATEDRTDTSIATSTSWVTIEMKLDPTNFKVKIGGTEFTETTELPASATDLMPHVEIETGAGAADVNIQIAPIWTSTGIS